ncbi:MAG: hypothetical protein QXQ57_07360 [Sulfolobales archaeon]
MRLSMLRWAVLFNLAKAWRLDLPIPVGRLVRVFKLNSSLTYKFLKELEAGGVVERVGRGLWALRDTARARALAEYVLELRPDSPFDYWTSTVPEVYYYIPDPPFKEWFGFPEKYLVIADEVLRGRISPPEDEYTVIYTSLRGRSWSYERSRGYSRGGREQSVADILSYDPNWPIEVDLYWNMDKLDMDDVARRCTPRGLRRLSTFLSFLALVSNPLPTKITYNYLALLDPEILWENLSYYTSIVYANGVADRWGI